MMYFTKILLACFAFLIITGTSKAQEEAVAADTIVLVSGRKTLGNVQGVSPSQVTYSPADSKEILKMDRKQVHKIIYRTGRVEIFNKLAFEMVEEGDWKTIILTEKQEDVEGLYALGNVDAQSSKNSRNARSAERSANIRLQKKAAAMGGYIVLITKRESKGGYGEIPTHLVEGVVYGFDPPTGN
ncbi:MAG TPA: hypothetical protein PLJ52_03880 [Tenuifilaceae bacterium]|nr:hypothetical protein [Tenuifilaceae bacterium]